jgi:osmotically-inducible protein OsmY
VPAITCPPQQLKSPSCSCLGDRARVATEALRRLRSTGYLALQDVSCDVHEECVHLRGRLPSYYLKQVAQTAVAEVEGVRRLINQIEVTAPTAPAGALCGGKHTAANESNHGDLPQSPEGQSPSIAP